MSTPECVLRTTERARHTVECVVNTTECVTKCVTECAVLESVHSHTLHNFQSGDTRVGRQASLLIRSCGECVSVLNQQQPSRR
jgi:hypothetical protein